MLGDEADSPRGRVQLIRTLVATEAAPSKELAGHLDACLVCRACETVCPPGVPFGRIMEGAREVLSERRKPGRVRGFVTRIGLGTIADHGRLAFAARLADLYARSPLAALSRRIGPIAWVSSLAPTREGKPYQPAETEDADVCFFAGCVMRETFGDSERATVRVIERSGHRVSAPIEQVCCGALHAHSGDGEQARRLARYNIDAFAGSENVIAVNAAGCGAHMKAYGDLLHDDPAWHERALAFARRVRETRSGRERDREADRRQDPSAAARRLPGRVPSRARATHPTAAAGTPPRHRRCDARRDPRRGTVLW